MSLLDINQLKERLVQLRAESETIQKQLEELGTLIVLADKYSANQVQATTPKQVTGDGALIAVGNAILRAEGQTKHELIISTCEEILSDGRRRYSRELVKELRERGIEVRSKNAAPRRRTRTAPACGASGPARSIWSAA